MNNAWFGPQCFYRRCEASLALCHEFQCCSGWGISIGNCKLKHQLDVAEYSWGVVFALQLRWNCKYLSMSVGMGRKHDRNLLSKLKVTKMFSLTIQPTRCTVDFGRRGADDPDPCPFTFQNLRSLQKAGFVRAPT